MYTTVVCHLEKDGLLILRRGDDTLIETVKAPDIIKTPAGNYKLKYLQRDDVVELDDLTATVTPVDTATMVDDYYSDVTEYEGSQYWINFLNDQEENLKFCLVKGIEMEWEIPE